MQLFFLACDHPTRYQVVAQLSVPNWPGTLWLTDQERHDTDYALFGEGTYGLTDALVSA